MRNHRIWVICAAVLLAFAVQEAALAQSILPSSEYRKLARAKLWEGLMNTGLQGADHDGNRRGGSPCLAYPGRGGSPFRLNFYWKALISPGTTIPIFGLMSFSGCVQQR